MSVSQRPPPGSTPILVLVMVSRLSYNYGNQILLHKLKCFLYKLLSDSTERRTDSHIRPWSV